MKIMLSKMFLAELPKMNEKPTTNVESGTMLETVELPLKMSSQMKTTMMRPINMSTPSSFEIADDTHWSAKVKVPLGLGGLKMSIAFTKLEERPLEFASLNAKGQGVGAMMNMTTSFSLSGDGATTSMAWEADVKIAGPVGSMGQRVLQPIINQQVGNVLAALDAEVQTAKAAAG